MPDQSRICYFDLSPSSRFTDCSGFRLMFTEVNLVEWSSLLSVWSLMKQRCWIWYLAGVGYRKRPQDQIIVGNRSPKSFLTQCDIRIGMVRIQETGQAMKNKQGWDQTRVQGDIHDGKQTRSCRRGWWLWRMKPGAFKGMKMLSVPREISYFPSRYVHIGNHLSFVPITATPKGFFGALQIPFALLRCIILGFLQTANGQWAIAFGVFCTIRGMGNWSD